MNHQHLFTSNQIESVGILICPVPRFPNDTLLCLGVLGVLDDTEELECCSRGVDAGVRGVRGGVGGSC